MGTSAEFRRVSGGWRAIENAKSNAGKFVLAVSKWGAARRIGVPVVRIFALGAGSRSSPAGPVRGTLRLSPAQVLELDEVPPFILELHARAASAEKRGGGKKKGREKGQLAGWMFWSGRVGRRGAIRPVDRARAPGNGAGSRRVSTGVDERGVRWMRRAHTRARVHPPPAPPRTIHRLQRDRHPFEPWIDESAAATRPITPSSIIQAPRRLSGATWRIAGTG